MSKRKKLIKTVIVGDLGVGKTSILSQFVHAKFTNTLPTIGTGDFQTKEIAVENTLVTNQIYDTAGQEKFDSISKTFYRSSDACLLVFDITNLESFKHLQQWKDKLIEGSGKNEDQIAFVIVANKMDLSDQRKVEKNQIEKLSKAWNIPYFEVSAKDGSGLDATFLEVTKIALSKEGDDNEVLTIPSIGKPPEMKQKGCCG